MNHRREVMKLSSNPGTDSGVPSGQPNDEQMERLIGNSTYFVENEIPGIVNHTLDMDALKTALNSSSMRVLPAGGSASREFFVYHCAAKLAEQLGTNIMEFPGHHVGYNTIQHKEFAERLHDVLGFD